MVIRLSSTVAATVALALLPCSAPLLPWQVYAFRDGSFDAVSGSPVSLSAPLSGPLPALPPSWRATASALADVTGDGVREWVLLIWRPWRDWPIRRWSSVPSPITGFHDVAGDSCHLILLDPQDGREIWAGSALPVPFLTLAVGDVDGDGSNEVVTLEGSYAADRDGPATYLDVWSWNGFGFALEWRSPPSVFHQLCLTDVDGCGILDIAVR